MTNESDLHGSGMFGRLVPISASTYRMTELAKGKEHKPDDQDDETDRRM
jgi:hypothetical protein